MTATQNDDASAALTWRRAWPVTGLALALLVNLLWVGALAYALVRLLCTGHLDRVTRHSERRPLTFNNWPHIAKSDPRPLILFHYLDLLQIRDRKCDRAAS